MEMKTQQLNAMKHQQIENVIRQTATENNLTASALRLQQQTKFYNTSVRVASNNGSGFGTIESYDTNYRDMLDGLDLAELEHNQREDEIAQRGKK